MRFPYVVLALSVLSGCGRGCSGKSTEVVVEAGVVVSASPPVEAAPAPVDLLYATNAIVAVSSRVDNPRDIPDHIVDHREDTAWNGKTGDLAGAWMAFRVPDDAHVDYVMVSAGFDKTSAKEDLFTGNYRISKVRILRDGVQLREATLDTDERRPQRLDIGTAGGDFKLEVTGTVPGSHAGWKEITVSELAVFGTPGKNLRAKPGPPLVRVGSLDVRETAYDDTAALTYEGACKMFIADDNAAADEANKVFGRDATAPAECTPPATHGPGHGNVVETAHVSITAAPRGAYETGFDGEVLALRSAAGVKLTNVRVSGKETAWFWNVTYELVSESWVGEQLVVDVQELRIGDSDGYAPPGHEDELHSEVKTVMRTTCDATLVTCNTSERK
jgi:hypothetical protein